MASKASSGIAWLIVLILVVAGVGGWNYQRNVAAENEVVRPYKGLSDADLAALSAAYEAEIGALDGSYQKVAAKRRTARDAAFMDEKVREFERVQRAGQATRSLGARVMERRAELELIRREVELRSGHGGEVAMILRRAFTF